MPPLEAELQPSGDNEKNSESELKMGVIKTLLGIVIVLAIIVFGYWLYATYTIASADDEMWVEVNSHMPNPLRKWACTEVNGRIATPDAPQGCSDVWQTAAAPQTAASPSPSATAVAPAPAPSTPPSPPMESNPAPAAPSGTGSTTNQ